MFIVLLMCLPTPSPTRQRELLNGIQSKIVDAQSGRTTQYVSTLDLLLECMQAGGRVYKELCRSRDARHDPLQNSTALRWQGPWSYGVHMPNTFSAIEPASPES